MKMGVWWIFQLHPTQVSISYPLNNNYPCLQRLDRFKVNISHLLTWAPVQQLCSRHSVDLCSPRHSWTTWITWTSLRLCQSSSSLSRHCSLDHLHLQAAPSRLRKWRGPLSILETPDLNNPSTHIRAPQHLWTRSHSHSLLWVPLALARKLRHPSSISALVQPHSDLLRGMNKFNSKANSRLLTSDLLVSRETCLPMFLGCHRHQ